MTALDDVLDRSQSLIELATELGRACVEDERLLREALGDPAVLERVNYLAELVGQIKSAVWLKPTAGGFRSLLDTDEINKSLTLLAPLDPADHLGVLRGLCRGSLQLFYKRFKGELTLARGTPLPNATRPIQKLFGSQVTPYQQSMTARDLLGRTGFDLFRETNPSVTVILDLSHRKALDAITWRAGKLPKVGTIHPRLDRGRIDYTLTGDLVFDVGQKDWSHAETLGHLEAVRGADITILPELCVPSPDALADALAADPSQYSPIVVAGSAHTRLTEGGLDSSVNESHIYIRGQRALSHRKIRPLETHQIGNVRFERLIREDLEPPQSIITLLSGDKTRMAVLICADINDGAIVRVLEECGVNLLLVPSLTYRTGGFNGAVCQLASHCQALCVIANPVLDKLDEQPQAPFLVLAAVPRSESREQSAEYPDSVAAPSLPTQTAVRALLDPNQPLASESAIRWV